MKEQQATTMGLKRLGKRIVRTWHSCLSSLFVSEFMLVPPITSCTPRPFWNVMSIVASLAAWLASSRVGQMTTAFIGLLPTKLWEPWVFRIVSITGSYTTQLDTLHKREHLYYCIWPLQLHKFERMQKALVRFRKVITKKAIVLPVPVLALASTSWPAQETPNFWQ